jgi:predicted outer membrane repeat protein
VKTPGWRRAFADNKAQTAVGRRGGRWYDDTQFTGNSAAQGGGVSASIVTLTGGLLEDNEHIGWRWLAAGTLTLTDTRS